MILGLLPLFRHSRPIVDDDAMMAFAGEIARTRNSVVERSLRRAREQISASVRGLLALLLGILLEWSPSGILLFFLLYTALSVAIDCMRAALIWSRINYCHARENRVLNVLEYFRSLKRNQRIATMRWRPQTWMLLATSVLCAAIVVPLVAFLLPKFEWAYQTSIFSNRFMPFLLLVLIVARVAQAALAVAHARASPLGFVDVLLDAEDSIDIFVGVLALSWTVFLFDGNAPLVIIVVILALRLLFRVAAWWSMRRALPTLSTYVHRTSGEDAVVEPAEGFESLPGGPDDSAHA